jgi:uncharacterized protein YdhG (YjbR/CyaY superfamily)
MNQVDNYIHQFPADVQSILYRIRSIIFEEAKDVVEHFAYGMPAYKSNNKVLVYFAAFKTHIGFYATPTGHTEFREALSPYKQGKGSVQFPLNREIPYDVIREVVAFRAKENLQKLESHKD